MDQMTKEAPLSDTEVTGFNDALDTLDSLYGYCRNRVIKASSPDAAYHWAQAAATLLKLDKKLTKASAAEIR